MNTDSDLGLDKLPEELIRKIYDMVDPADRPSMALASKRLLDIRRRHYDGKMSFHIQGWGESMFSNAIKTLKAMKHRSLTSIRFSKFNFDTHWARYWMRELVKGDYCPSRDFLDVKSVEIRGCVTTDFFLARLLEAFPNTESLTLDRCIFVKHKPKSKRVPFESDYEIIGPSKIQKLRMSLPFYADPPERAFIGWLVQCLVLSSKIEAKEEYFQSEISFKRFVFREFCRRKKIDCDRGVLDRYRVNM